MFPGWPATIVHVPTAISETLVPETVHTVGVCEENSTGSAEDALAETVKGDCEPLRLASGAKLIDWPALLTVKVCGTGAAGLKFPFPTWIAVIVQDPACEIVTVDPETVHTFSVEEL